MAVTVQAKCVLVSARMGSSVLVMGCVIHSVGNVSATLALQDFLALSKLSGRRTVVSRNASAPRCAVAMGTVITSPASARANKASSVRTAQVIRARSHAVVMENAMALVVSVHVTSCGMGLIVRKLSAHLTASKLTVSA